MLITHTNSSIQLDYENAPAPRSPLLRKPGNACAASANSGPVSHALRWDGAWSGTRLAAVLEFKMVRFGKSVIHNRHHHATISSKLASHVLISLPDEGQAISQSEIAEYNAPTSTGWSPPLLASSRKLLSQQSPRRQKAPTVIPMQSAKRCHRRPDPMATACHNYPVPIAMGCHVIIPITPIQSP